jgi:hypothetical protein
MLVVQFDCHSEQRSLCGEESGRVARYVAFFFDAIIARLARFPIKLHHYLEDCEVVSRSYPDLLFPSRSFLVAEMNRIS